MSNSRIQHGLRLFLAASVLAATTISTPSVVHCHSGGHRLHGHDPGPHDVGQRLWHHGSGTPVADRLCEPGVPPRAVPAGDQECHAVAVADDLHQHVFLVFLGRTIPLPVRDQGGGSPGGSLPDLQWLLACRDQNRTPNCPGGSDLPAGFTPQLDHRADRDLVGQCQGPPCKVAAVPPLCDRARHERSGVQLA